MYNILDLQCPPEVPVMMSWSLVHDIIGGCHKLLCGGPNGKFKIIWGPALKGSHGQWLLSFSLFASRPP